MQVDHRGQVQPTLAGAKVGDVAHELVGGNGAVEVAAHQVGAGLALGSGTVVLFFALGVQPRIPGSRINFRTR